MARIYWKLEQGSPDWFKVRSGIPTASCFDQIITPKKMELASARRKYQCRLIAERLLNWQAESLDTIKHIEDGKLGEPFAVGQLQALAEIELQRVGFVTTNDGRFGASPDRAVSSGKHKDVEDGSLGVVAEVKCPTIPRQFEYLLLGHGEAYRCQVQGQLFVAEADKAIFYSYNQRMPAYHVETGRDEPFIRKLSDALEQFSDELEEMTERAKSFGVFQAFEEMVTPVEAERADGIRHGPPPTEAEIDELVGAAVGARGSEWD